jgi:hypothetical protein
MHLLSRHLHLPSPRRYSGNRVGTVEYKNTTILTSGTYSLRPAQCAEDQVTLSMFRHGQEVIHHRHTVFRRVWSQLDIIPSDKRRRDQLELHYGKTLAQTRTSARRKGHEQRFGLGGHGIRFEPTFWQE